MKKVFRLILLIAVGIILSHCGSEKAPSGGPKDTVKPKIVSVDPGEYESIADGNVEITFSKPIDRATVLTGIHIYPPILKKKYRWPDGNTLGIRIYERLEENTNYYVMLSKNIKGMHGNPLEEDYLYTFASGELQRMRLSGNIEYELPKDTEKPIILSLFDADTVNVYKTRITGSNYVLENLNPGGYIIESFIDLIDNDKYDYGTEPWFRQEIELNESMTLDWQMAYEDSLAPSLKSVKPLSATQLVVELTEPVQEIGSVRIRTQDSLAVELPVIEYRFFEDTLHVLTEAQDTLKYMLEARGLRDLKDNFCEIDSIFFEGKARPDTTAPRVTHTVPRNGTSITTRMPEIHVWFSEIILTKDLEVSMRSAETGEAIDVEVVEGNSSRFVLKPVQRLTNYNTYVLTIGASTADPSGNELRQPVDVSMIPVVRE